LCREILTKGWDDADALAGAGHAIAGIAKDYEQGWRAVERALTLNPNSARVLATAGWICCHLSQGEKAQGYFEKALRLSPTAPETTYISAGLALSLLLQREYAKALEITAQALQRTSPYIGIYRMEIWALVGLGRPGDAKVAGERFLQLFPDTSISRGAVALSDPAKREEYFDALRAAGIPD
jgi:adenylate cyclase